MSEQLTLFAPSGLNPADVTGIKHICFPDFSLACGLGYLEKPDGDRVHLGRPQQWAEVTCDWCRALGREYVGRVYAMFRARS